MFYVFALSVAFLLFIGFILIYSNQNRIIQAQLSSLNQNFEGKVEVGPSNLALFQNFPYVSLRVNAVKIYESKQDQANHILNVDHIYVGFGLWDVVRGNFDIKSVIIEDGLLDVVLHPDGKTNLENALATASRDTSSSEPINIHLKDLELRNIEFHQKEEATNLDIAAHIGLAKGGFKSKEGNMQAHVDMDFVLDVIDNGDTSYLNNKHFEVHTDISLNQKTGVLLFQPSGIKMEHGDFELEGSIDTKNDMTVDLSIRGSKPNFDMFIAFAPTEIIPLLERYENAGNIYFNATLKGPTTNGRQPFIETNFGASEAFLENTESVKRIDHVGFTGYFTNGNNRDLSTMAFSMNDITAQLEQGKIKGSVSVVNFEEPDIEMAIDTDFSLDFWAAFLNLKDIETMKGDVKVSMKFHDIINLDQPEKAMEDLSQAYYAKFIVEDFSLQSDKLPAPINDVDLSLSMEGREAVLEYLNLDMGKSDVAVKGVLSDLPAIVHHLPTTVNAQLEISSQLIDLEELTQSSSKDSSGIREQIQNLRTRFSFNALGNAFTEFSYLPKGAFRVDDFYADLQHYPHTLHDFTAAATVGEEHIEIEDVSGFVDSSDFHLTGTLHDYGFWMTDTLEGDAKVDLNLTSDLLKFSNLFTYQGVNYVPPEYRHEEIQDLNLHFTAKAHFDSSQLVSAALHLDKWQGKMKLHPLKFENFSGDFYWEPKYLKCEDFKGTLGKTSFNMNVNYHVDDKMKGDNFLSLQSDYINFDELFKFELGPSNSNKPKANTTKDVATHAKAFNIFNIPFPDLKMHVDVGRFTYHRYDLKKVNVLIRTTSEHFLYVDTFSMNAAGGLIAMNGYFNGSDSERIYLKPKLRVENVDLDQLLFKFENFGQDVILSENLHGQLSADVRGEIRVYPDLIPDLDQSEIHLDASVLNGSLENFEPMMLLSGYFSEEALQQVEFDTLQNHIDITQGVISIPSMNIESSLGHLEVAGTQDMQDNINYLVRIPWSLVKEAAKNKLFRRENSKVDESEIVEVEPGKKTKYLNVNIVGTTDDFDIKLRKPKS